MYFLLFAVAIARERQAGEAVRAADERGDRSTQHLHQLSAGTGLQRG